MQTQFKKALRATAVVALATSMSGLAHASTPNQHFTFIHSAWMGGWQWQSLVEQLGDGIQTTTPDLAAHGSDLTDPASVTLDTYVNQIVNEIDRTERQTILFAHSFGGVVASQVAEARPDKIDAIVYLCAFMLPNGASFLDATEGVKTSKVLNNLVFSEDGKTVSIAEHAIHDAVAHDVPADVFLQAKPNLVVEPVAPLGTKLNLTDQNYGSIPRYYIECTEDQALPIDLQRGMYAQQPVEKVYSIVSSHVPMFSDPDSVVAALIDIASREHVRNATQIASQAWQKAFNAGDAAGATALYEKDALMVAQPFGQFNGHNEIEGFWRDLIEEKGAAEIEYIDPSIEVLNATSARLTSRWKMNIAGGEITNEHWVLQEDGTMLLREDHFEAK